MAFTTEEQRIDTILIPEFAMESWFMKTATLYPVKRISITENNGSEAENQFKYNIFQLIRGPKSRWKSTIYQELPSPPPPYS